MIMAVSSDAHGAGERMNALLDTLPPIDVFCFLGDMDKDAEHLSYGLREKQPKAAFLAVAGNNDPFSQRPKSIEMTFEGVKTLLTHGHLFRNVRQSQRPMALQAEKMGCALVLYGHTHRAKDTCLDGVRLVNPGALMQGHWALLSIRGDQVEVMPQMILSSLPQT